jgi:hypothetical protein
MLLCVRRRTLPMTSIRPNHLRATSSRKNFGLRPALDSGSAPPQHAPPCTPLHTSGTYGAAVWLCGNAQFVSCPERVPLHKSVMAAGLRFWHPGLGRFHRVLILSPGGRRSFYRRPFSIPRRVRLRSAGGRVGSSSTSRCKFPPLARNCNRAEYAEIHLDRNQYVYCKRRGAYFDNSDPDLQQDHGSGKETSRSSAQFRCF